MKFTLLFCKISAIKGVPEEPIRLFSSLSVNSVYANGRRSIISFDISRTKFIVFFPRASARYFRPAAPISFSLRLSVNNVCIKREKKIIRWK